ncbi:MAG TPA: FMN-binding protein [Candidatus Paceibacterota bacterium]|nr:FMN-binding protein [Candidatus Paceibacterota bacterium]
MTTPQLIAYIREQSAAGTPHETIRRSLLLNEWSEQDINEAFDRAATTVSPKISSVPAAPNAIAGRKFALSFALIAVSVIYAVWQNIGSSQSFAMTTPAVSSQTTTVPPVTPLPTKTTPSQPPKTKVNTPAPAPVPVPQKPSGQYVDGSYTGDSADAYYGTVQVQAIVTNGKLSDVQFLQYPNEHSYSQYVNSQAMPMLTQEAIQAQSANVSGVSGATETSMAFVQSLASALAQAKN